MKRRSQSLPAFLKSLPKGAVIGWRDLDPWLDGGDRAFARDVRKLDRAFDARDVRIRPMHPEDPGEAEGYEMPYRQQGSLRRDGLGLYERELGKLPRLNRVGEFRMAKRYEFLRFRLEESLVQAGFDEEERKAICV